MVVVVVVVIFRNTASLVIGLPGLALAAAGAWWVMTENPAKRFIGIVGVLVGLGLVVVAIILTVSRPEDVILGIAATLILLALPLVLARYSLTRPPANLAVTGERRPRQRPERPVLLANPWSGGGKVEKFDLIPLANELGIEVVMLDHGLDLEKLTRHAVDQGADCLGMAGGDGSQALVASVAVERGLPFVCISAGTRNHFALDLGLDREDPRAGLMAFRDAVERRVDYATVNNRLFVNNVSLGIYATIVQSEDYRDNKMEVTTSMLTDMLGNQAEPFDLQYTTPKGKAVDGAFLIMVSNNPYVLGAKLDIAQRRRMDSGGLGVFAVSTRTGAQAARLVTLAALGVHNVSRHFYEFTADQFVVNSRSGTTYMGVDGEALEADTPLRFEIHPAGLHMFVPDGNLAIAEQRRARTIRLGDVGHVAMGREPQALAPTESVT